jgi:hypothetical protein
MYDVGKILVAGGGNSLAATYKIDINGGSPVVTSAGNMAYGRRQNNLTILSDGSVLVTGGNSAGSAPGTTESYLGNQFSLSGAVYPAEIWKPSTNTWTTVASMGVLYMEVVSVPRVYLRLTLKFIRRLICSIQTELWQQGR